MKRTRTAMPSLMATLCALLCMRVPHCERQVPQRLEQEDAVVHWNLADSVPYGYTQFSFRRLPTERQPTPQVRADTAHLRNGDRLSGVIQGISEGILVFRQQSVAQPLSVPLENVRAALFKDRKGWVSEAPATALFVNGDSLQLTVSGYDGTYLLAKTRFSDEIRVKKEHLAGIVFRREPRILYQVDFAAGETGGFEGLQGNWGISEAPLVLQSASHSNSAHLKLPQQGHLRYSWKVSNMNSSPPNAGFYFFAQNPDPNVPGNCHQVRTSGGTVYLYRTVRNMSQHIASFNLPSNPRRTGESSRKFDVDYDSASGTIRVSVDGTEMLAGIVSPAVAKGDYIILTRQSRDRFHYLRVEQVMDPPSPATRSPGGDNARPASDSVFLVNGDRLSGEITKLSDGKLKVQTAYSSEPLEVSQKEVSSLEFAGAGVKQTQTSPMVSFRNGDRLTGEVIALEANTLRLRSPYIGGIEANVHDVASVLFLVEKEASALESAAEARTGPPTFLPGDVLQTVIRHW